MTRWLIDTSALFKLERSPDPAVWHERMQRGLGVADLLVAAAAEVLGLTVLHVDRDFELIAEVTGQPVERLAIG